jgi:signal transduction histidine kinase
MKAQSQFDRGSGPLTIFRLIEDNVPHRRGRVVKRKLSFFLSLAAGLAVLSLCIYGHRLLRLRPGVPPSVPESALVRIGDVEILSVQDRDAALVGKEIGDLAVFEIREANGARRTITAPVVSYFAASPFPLLYLLIGLFCIAIGTATYVLKPADLRARLFYALTLVFGAGQIISGEYYGLHPDRWTTFLPSLFFILAYALVPAVLLDLARSFAPEPVRRRRILLYVPALLFAGVQTFVFLTAFLKPSVAAIHFYGKFYMAFRIYVLAFILAAVVALGRALGKCRTEERRSQIQWIFYGLAVGVFPFLLLYQIPILLGLKPVVSEELVAVCFAAIPVAFAIAIVRHRLMDISLVINRSLVYSVLTVFTIGIYLLVVQVAERGFARLASGGSDLFTAAGVFLAAAAFRPAQRKIQDLVDRTFFRQRYDYRRVVLDFNECLRRFVGRDELAACFLRELREAIPVEFLSLRLVLRRPAPAEREEFLVFGDPWPAGFPLLSEDPGEWAVWGRPAGVLIAPDIDFGAGDILEALRIDLAFRLPFSPETGSGALAVGRKKAGGRFSREDIELIRTMAGELVVNLERVGLQEDIIYERASKEKLDELNRLKTEFISTVSHELRTPMSSIQGLAEVLQGGRIADPEKRERYLRLLAGESARLSRFLHNVLDFGRIERGAMAYRFAPTDLRAIVREAIEVFRPAAEAEGFELAVRLPDTAVERLADADAVKQALINLIDNAIKYSGGNRMIEIGLIEKPGAAIYVRDQGVGVMPEDRERIFEKFYRAENVRGLRPEGAGLGLKVVRHIMEAHGGDVRLESEPGRGSEFRLVFPEP